MCCSVSHTARSHPALLHISNTKKAAKSSMSSWYMHSGNMLPLSTLWTHELGRLQALQDLNICTAGHAKGNFTLMIGTPMSSSKRLHSSLCCCVTRTVRLAYLATSSALPACKCTIRMLGSFATWQVAVLQYAAATMQAFHVGETPRRNLVITDLHGV